MQNLSGKVSRILNLFFFCLLLIFLRVWYLSIVAHEEHFKLSRRPQRRTFLEPPERATIRDRFNLPLAINKLQYNVAICYSDIKQIPITGWEKSQKILLRKRYVEQLCQFLSEELSLPSQEIEDVIYGKAALFPHTPFILKEDIPEALYARLKMAEKQWLGLQTISTSKRHYPRGKCACDLIGYLGAINQEEYFKVTHEIETLKNYLAEREEGKVVFLPKGFTSAIQVRKRLKELEQRAYSINDFVGKSGVEAAFDGLLRGVYGKKMVEVDQKGNIVRELPGSSPAMSGERLILTISADLQEAAEELLAEYELFQDLRDGTRAKERRPPWMRGSSIVAMDPKTGEILALASYPRFDPGDFILARNPHYKAQKNSLVRRWLENEAHIAELWDGKRPLERELFSVERRSFYEEARPLSWEAYIEMILPKESRHLVSSVEEALQVQENPESYTPLLVDLMRLIARPEDLPVQLRKAVGTLSLSKWRLYNQIACRYRSQIQAEMKALFKSSAFQKWREEHFKSFLKKKRAEEKATNIYARPYTDYLEAEQQKQFKAFWEENRLLFFHGFVMKSAPPRAELLPYFQKLFELRKSLGEEALEELDHFLKPLDLSSQLYLLKAWRSFDELTSPLKGRYPQLRSEKGVQLEKHLAAAFYPQNGFGYGKSQAFREAAPLGSVFKLIPAYAILKKRAGELEGHAHGLKELNPMTIIDESRSPNSQKILGRFSSGEPIPRHYKGGRMPRSSYSMGQLDLMGAIEQSSNIYFSILAGDFLDDVLDLTKSASAFGLGEKTGIDLPGEYKGLVPLDVLNNKSGLYSLAIGQHSLVVTPLQTAVMFSAIANGGKVLKPQIIKLSAGKQCATTEEQLFFQNEFPYKSALGQMGLSFPLFTETIRDDALSYIRYRKPEVKATLPLEKEVRSYLIQSLHKVTNGSKGLARPSAINKLYHDPLAFNNYLSLQPRLIGKTGTAEILHRQSVDPTTPAALDKHVWFVGISFLDDALEKPDLVVAVYLRFGSSGKEGAPLAARIVQRWREILDERLRITEEKQGS